MSVEKSGQNPVDVSLPPSEEADPPAIKHVGSLRVLMEFYESAEAEVEDENENEVDLMIQLSGMTNNGAQGND